VFCVAASAVAVVAAATTPAPVVFEKFSTRNFVVRSFSRRFIRARGIILHFCFLFVSSSIEMIK
jgi:hypothetical protein